MIDSNIKSKLENIKQLYDSKTISESEYNVLKEEVLFEQNIIDKSFKKETTNQVNNQNSIYKQKSVITNSNSAKGNDSIVYIVVFCLLIGVWLMIKTDNNNSYNSNSIDNTLDTLSIVNESISDDSSTTCKICGDNFFGDGYDKIDGIWQKNTSMQTELCSSSCARKESERMDNVYDNILEKHGYGRAFTEKCSKCGSYYVDGFCERCGAASAEKVYESYSNRPNCDLCNGAGYMYGGNGSNLVCPSCSGTGKFSH
jgi:hypothetical protein